MFTVKLLIYPILLFAIDAVHSIFKFAILEEEFDVAEADDGAYTYSQNLFCVLMTLAVFAYQYRRLYI